MPKKSFRLFDAVLMSVVVILVVESAAPAAAIGASQFFWWGLLLILFFLPYGLISAELGTTYDDEGGIYDWVKKAFGRRWGARVAWFYWINFPIWMASLAVLFQEVFSQIFQIDLPLPVTLFIQILFIWIVTFISCYPVSDSKWILNIAAFSKVTIMLCLGILGVYHAVTKGMANDFSGNALLPQLDIQNLSFLSVILFNFLGFEVVTTLASDMDNPGKQIPQAIVYGGILIAFFYLFAAFGMGAAVPAEQLSTSGGLIDSFILLVGGLNPFVVIMGLLFMYTLAANLISWALGVNYVALYAAKNADLPPIFAKESSKNQMPIGASFLNGVIATLLVASAPLIPNENIFWAFFSLNVVALLLSYIMMFPAFLRLRKLDPQIERPFKVPGPQWFLNLVTFVPLILLIATLLFSVIPLDSNASEFNTKIPVLAGTLLTFAIGEIVIHRSNKKKKNSKGVLQNENN